MRKRYVPEWHTVFLGMLLILFTLTGRVGWSQAQEKVIELTFASPISETTLMTVQEKLWAAEIEKRTKGRVKVTKWHYGGAICSSAEQMGCIARGLADVGYLGAAYNPADLRLTTLSEMVYVNNAPGADVKARVDLYETFPAFREEVRAAGIEILTFHVTPVGIMGISKRKTINSTADLKGIKSHTYGPVADVFRNVGVTPVAMQIGEVYESMSRGVIDAWFTPLYYIIPSRFYEVTGTVVDPGIGTYSSPLFIMNRKTFDSLPKDIQKIIDDLRRDQVLAEARAAQTQEEDTLVTLRKEAPHIKFVRFSEKARAEWKRTAKTDEIVEKLIKEREGRSPQAREFFQKYEELVKKYEPEMRKHFKSGFDLADTKVID